MSEVKCPHCGQRYTTKSLKGQEIVTASDGLPAVVCQDCHWQVPLIEEVDAKRLLNKIKAHERYLKGV
jgi:hypothetical protein